VSQAVRVTSSSLCFLKAKIETLIVQSTCTIVVALFVLFIPSAAVAGEVVLYSTSPLPLACQVDGYYMRDKNGESKLMFTVKPGERLSIPPSSPEKTIDWIDCGSGLRTRAMNITVTGPDVVLFLTGQQKRTLNVSLYVSIPTDPIAGYAPLVRWLTLAYQAQHPDVLLNVVFNPAVDPYDFSSLQRQVFGANGFDVAEIDTVMLTYLVQNHLISEAKITGEEPWPVAKQAATVDGRLYGVPSWLCSDFLFSGNASLASVHTFADLQQYMRTMPTGRRKFVGYLNGTWTIPSLYLQAFAQTYPEKATNDALKMPADEAVIDKMIQFGADCAINGDNPCTDNRYHKAADGSVERAFAGGEAQNDLGFSERSFFLVSDLATPQSLSVTPMPWGDSPDARPYVYSDAFVTNSQTCSSAACQADSQSFSAFMTSVGVKKNIAFSKDLPYGSAARHLLPATKAFYDPTVLKGDPIYTQVLKAFLERSPRAYLNNFTPQMQHDLLSGICTSLQKMDPKWICNVP
jgi:thiamine pyridinylase